ncbi:GntP family permease, partial [Staphylococcus pasteuri]
MGDRLMGKFGEKDVEWGMVIGGLMVGIGLLFEVGVVLLMGVVLRVGKGGKVCILKVGVGMV